MNESGVYFAVRILFRGNCCIGCPSSSWSSGGNGRLKKSCLDDELLLCASSTLLPSFGASESAVPPDALFFSLAAPLLCFPSNESRFMELLVTVNLRVAHLDLCTESDAPAGSPAPPPNEAMVEEASRARPDHPEMLARMAKARPIARPKPL